MATGDRQLELTHLRQTVLDLRQRLDAIREAFAKWREPQPTCERYKRLGELERVINDAKTTTKTA